MGVLSSLTHNQADQDWPDARPGRNMSFSEDGPAPLVTAMRQEIPGLVFDEMQPPDFSDMANDVRDRLAQHLRGTSLPFLLTDDETGLDEEGAAPHHIRTTIKSSKLRTRDIHILNRIKLPHEMFFYIHGAGTCVHGYELGFVCKWLFGNCGGGK